MKNKLILFTLTIMLTAALIGGATMAWFTDSDSSDPVTFAAGTLLIEAGTSMIYGVEADTGDIYEIDVISGTKHLLFDKTIGTTTDKYVNALAFDRVNKRLYYTARDTRIYFYDFSSETYVGKLKGGRTAGAAFGRGYYWYIPQGTDDLWRVSFDSNGSIIADQPYFENFADLSFNFGDVAMDIQGNVLYGSASSGSSDSAKKYFAIDLVSKTYEEIESGSPHHMQVAFGADGLLYGHATAGSQSAGGEKRWYALDAETGNVIKELDWSPGEKNFNDLASNFQNNWNPGDCDIARFYVKNTGTKKSYVRVKWEMAEWLEEELSIDNVTITPCDDSWKPNVQNQTDEYLYYHKMLEPGEEALLCVTVCLDGDSTGNEYQGETYKLQPIFEAIQVTHNATVEEWGWNPPQTESN